MSDAGSVVAKATIGANVMVVWDGKLLLGKRINIAGEGYWGLPGGRIDMGEHPVEAAKRELYEETGLKVGKLDLVTVASQIQNSEHWIQFGFRADEFMGEVVNMEPDYCDGWEWFEMNDLPEKVFPAHVKQIEGLRGDAGFLIEEELEI